MDADKLIVNVDELVEVGSETNIRAAVVNDQLILVVDLTQNLGKTSSGVSVAYANSHGFNLLLNDGLRFNLWVGKKIQL